MVKRGGESQENVRRGLWGGGLICENYGGIRRSWVKWEEGKTTRRTREHRELTDFPAETRFEDKTYFEC